MGLIQGNGVESWTPEGLSVVGRHGKEEGEKCGSVRPGTKGNLYPSDLRQIRREARTRSTTIIERELYEVIAKGSKEDHGAIDGCWR